MLASPKRREVRRIQLNLNSLGSSRLSLIPSANDGLSLYGLATLPSLDVGLAFSSFGSLEAFGRRDEKGMRKGGMRGDMFVVAGIVTSIEEESWEEYAKKMFGSRGKYRVLDGMLEEMRMVAEW